ncbi:DUF3558 domain-containing protein [Nocardia fusca]|uniref:DUF3558 domain-containing protein n=1 Tax=Nocardia fusca TaxID=941183 RepID=UPI0037B1F5BF
MRTAKRHSAGIAAHAVLAVLATALAAGCGTTIQGEPDTKGESTTGQEASAEWNPCSQLPDDALRAAGADPSQKNTAVDAPGDRAFFRICAWDSLDGPFHIGVGSMVLAQDEWYDNSEVTGVTPRQINDRAGLTFYPDNGDQPIRQCYVSLPMASGSLFVDVDWQYSQRDSLPESPPCELAVQHAQKLEPFLPD